MPSVGEDMTSVVEASCNFGPKEAMVQRHQGLQRLENDGKRWKPTDFDFVTLQTQSMSQHCTSTRPIRLEML